MFTRSVKIRSSNGMVYEYLRIVSSVRENRKVKRKIIANLGPRDTLAAILPMLNYLFKGDGHQSQPAR